MLMRTDSIVASIVIPTVGSIVLTGGNILALEAEWLSGPLVAPLVAFVAVVARYVDLRTALYAAAISMLLYNFFVIPPHFSFQSLTVSEVVAATCMVVLAKLLAPKADPALKPNPCNSVCRATGLPFVREAEGDTPRRFWVVEPTGDWVADSTLGECYGRLYLEHLGEIPLCYIMAEMIKKGQFSGVEAGFLAVVDRYLRCRCA